MRRSVIIAVLTLLAPGATPLAAKVPVSLRGSSSSMERQHELALGLELPFVRTPDDVAELAGTGTLTRLVGNANLEVADFVSYPHVHPALGLFLNRLAADYRAATGEKLVVTSLTRPVSQQPRNAHRLSVHPTGTAVDLRVSRRAESRAWLERTLLELEERGLLDVTREKSPPHYHVALFIQPYQAHLSAELGAAGERALARAALIGPSPAPSAPVAVTGEDVPRGWIAGLLGLLLAVPGALFIPRVGGAARGR